MKRSSLSRSSPAQIAEWRRRSAQASEERAREQYDHKYRRIGSNRERRKKEHERAYGLKAKWIRTLPSVVSGRSPSVCAHINPRDRMELPHGMGRKHSSKWTVPLTLDEERELHRIGQDSFEEKHTINLTEEAECYERAWRQ